MRNEALCDKRPKARSGGRPFRFSMERSDGGLRACRLEGSGRLEACWAIGSISTVLSLEAVLDVKDTDERARDYDIHGPAGPTAFWKESDELEEEKLG